MNVERAFYCRYSLRETVKLTLEYINHRLWRLKRDNAFKRLFCNLKILYYLYIVIKKYDYENTECRTAGRSG